ncbi:MAG: YdcF family protein [Nanoarchaeota archaeon]
MKVLDFILIHAFTLDENHRPNKIHRQRLDYGLQLFNDGLGKEMIVAGKLDNRDKRYFEETGIPLSKIMKEYLVARGIPENNIHEEPLGENTYDCTLNSFKGIILPRKWNSGIITSSSEHLPRINLQTMKVLHQMNVNEDNMMLFYSGPSIRYSGETTEEIKRFISHEAKGMIHTLEKKD